VECLVQPIMIVERTPYAMCVVWVLVPAGETVETSVIQMPIAMLHGVTHVSTMNVR